MKISKNPNVNWKNNQIQFPRLIAELQANGFFNDAVYDDLQESMDLSVADIQIIIDNACNEWDVIKSKI